jgi:putative protein-disulfide isomerase
LLKIFRAFQRAFYVDGLDTTDGRVLAEIGAAGLREGGFSVTVEQFFQLWSSDEAIQAAAADFAFTQKLGVSGFPTLFVEWNGKRGRLGSGYMHADDVQRTLESLAN